MGGVVAGFAYPSSLGNSDLPPDIMLRSGSEILSRNIVNARDEVKDQGDAAHHIVAWGDYRAEDSRQILDKVGMDINDANNGLFMHSMYHQRIHTESYHRNVYENLSGAASYDEAASRLAGIRARIQAGTFPF